MTLQEALKISPLIVTATSPSLIYFLRGGDLWCRGHGSERKSEMSLAEIIHYDWAAYVEPCKHEPVFVPITLTAFPPKDGSYFKCKNCGLKIKAEKWAACD